MTVRPLQSGEGRALEGTHLAAELRARVPDGGVYVCAGFLASLDGRIAVGGGSGPPDSIANDRDWRLFTELLMQADVVLSSGRYVRDVADGIAQDLLPNPDDERFEDLFAWRRERGLARLPTVAVLTASGVLDPAVAATLSDEVLVVTGRDVDSELTRELETAGIGLVVTERGPRVDAASLIPALEERGLRLIVSAAGPHVLRMLAPRLDALFLTVAGKLVGGRSYSTLWEGDALEPPPAFRLHAAHLAELPGEETSQLFLELRRVGTEPAT